MKREHSRSRYRLCKHISEIVRTLQPHPQCRTRAHNRSRVELFNAACGSESCEKDLHHAAAESTVALFALQTLNSP